MKTFQTEFLNPLLEINKDGRVGIQVKDNKLISIVKGNSESILLSEYSPILIDDPVDRFFISLSKLDKGIRCIKSETFSEFSIENNYLEYKDDKLKFNVKLLQPNMIPDSPKISPESITNHPIEGTVKVSYDDMKEIMRAKSFVSDIKKMYLSQEGEDAIFEFGDREIDHKDNIKVVLKDSCDGTFNSCVYENTILDLFFRNKCDKLFKIGARALIVDIEQDNSKLTYLTAKLKK